MATSLRPFCSDFHIFDEYQPYNVFSEDKIVLVLAFFMSWFYTKAFFSSETLTNEFLVFFCPVSFDALKYHSAIIRKKPHFNRYF